MDIRAAIKFGLFVREAERLDDHGSKGAYKPPNGYRVIEAIYANDLTTDIHPIKGYVSLGYIAQSPDPGTDLVVAIRGTSTIWEWVQDAQFLKTPYPFLAGAGDTEDGFTDLYETLRIAPDNAAQRVVDVLRNLFAGKEGMTLTLCGHSLGAAISTLLAVDVVANKVSAAPAVFTFASPYVGDTLFASTYDRLAPHTWRIADQMDIITHLPPRLAFGYEHVKQGYLVNSAGKVKMDVLCYHHLTTYLHLLSLLDGGSVIPLDADCKP